MTEFRCNRLHGILNEHGQLEVTCRSRFCGWEPGIIVLHYFDVATGQLLQTQKFQAMPKPEQQRG